MIHEKMLGSLSGKNPRLWTRTVVQGASAAMSTAVA